MAGSIHHEQLPPKSVFLLSSCYSFNPERQFCILRWNSHWCPLADSRHWISKRAHHCKLLRSTQVLSGPVLGFLCYLIPLWSADGHSWSFITRFILCLRHRRCSLTTFIFYAFFFFLVHLETRRGAQGTPQVMLCQRWLSFPRCKQNLYYSCCLPFLYWGKNAGSSNHSNTNILYFTLVSKFNFVGSAKK